jgi:hypothetical protein
MRRPENAATIASLENRRDGRARALGRPAADGWDAGDGGVRARVKRAARRRATVFLRSGDSAVAGCPPARVHRRCRRTAPNPNPDRGTAARVPAQPAAVPTRGRSTAASPRPARHRSRPGPRSMAKACTRRARRAEARTGSAGAGSDPASCRSERRAESPRARERSPPPWDKTTPGALCARVAV